MSIALAGASASFNAVTTPSAAAPFPIIAIFTVLIQLYVQLRFIANNCGELPEVCCQKQVTSQRFQQCSAIQPIGRDVPAVQEIYALLNIGDKTITENSIIYIFLEGL